ncbi:MAG: nuclear transport factor 2 family protein [Bacteroidota bacterium]
MSLKWVWLLGCLLGSLQTLSAQESDYAAVSRALGYYLDGGTQNDFSTLKKAFHPDAVMMAAGDPMMRVNALEFFGSRMKPGPPANRRTRICEIKIDGEVATARLEIKYPDFRFVDHMQLIKVDGAWKIVSKLFYKHDNALVDQD